MNQTINTSKSYTETDILQKLKHFLPSQTPIKDFIHHNTLHAFQGMKFYDAIFKASKIFGYQVTLELNDFRKLYSQGRIKENILDHVIITGKSFDSLNAWKEKLISGKYNEDQSPRVGMLRAFWKSKYKIDLDNAVQPILFRVLCSYLDQGISLSRFPLHPDGFLASIRELEKNSYTSFFKSDRVKDLLLDDQTDLNSLLQIIVGHEDYFEQYLFDQQFSHQGWSGIVAAVEDAPHTLLDERKITFHDLIMIELLLEIDALDDQLGYSWAPIATSMDHPPIDLFSNVDRNELNEVMILWQNAFEWSYYDDVLSGIKLQRSKNTNTSKEIPIEKTFQAIFCIDERECSIRRHIEHIDPRCETLGSPGFFGVEFYFQAEGGLFYEKLCPAPVTPKYLIKEFDSNQKRKHEILYSSKSQMLITGTLNTLVLGYYACIRLIQTLFFPKMSPAISNAYAHMNKQSTLTIQNDNPDHKENNLQIGFTIEEMATRVENLLRGIGLVQDFASLVYTIAHGSSSANNPHHSAHDCGACSGRPGSVNARVFAWMANHPEVRSILQSKGIQIPVTTFFVGGMHDTAADQIEFYDEQKLSDHHKKQHQANLLNFNDALNANAKERSRRFSSINTKQSLKGVRKSILQRSVSMFEPRPELGHGTNSLCIVGRRSITKKLFLDRRAFLNSYDYRNDPDGSLLTGVMKPIGLVCGGINLEYYFSRVDNYKLGAGTKLPHNVMGLIGVANSSDGDLRPGLPVQMIEVHDPVRLLILVEHKPEIVLKAIQSSPEIYEWYINEWVHLIALDPVTNQFYYFHDGVFSVYLPLNNQVQDLNNTMTLVEQSLKMETNYITDATRENLPVYSLN
ncbi:MAG: DUF2309 domain-containing protein [Saprospiraceae bacterium]